MVSKCCFCFDLKDGYYTYAIVIAGLRISILFFTYLYLPHLCYSNIEVCGIYLTSFGWFTGWLVTSVLFCFLAILGMIKESSIIIYPYIVIAITELVAFTMGFLFASIFLYTYFVFAMFASLFLYGYDLWCLISLYMKVKRTESRVGLYSYANDDV